METKESTQRTDAEKALIDKVRTSPFTDADKDLLREYFKAADEIAQREPERLTAEMWDSVWPAIQATGDVPAAYRDRIGVKETTVYDTIDENGNYQRIPEGKTTKGYYDIVWESWNTERNQLVMKYRQILLKFFFHAMDNDNAVSEFMPLDEFCDRYFEDPFITSEIEKSPYYMVTSDLLSSPYLPMLNGSLVSDIMQINTRSITADPFTKRASITYPNGRKITIENFDKLLKALSTPAKKILNTAIIYLTNINYFKARNVTPTVEIPLIEYGEACGYQLTPRKMATKEEQDAENKIVKQRIKELQKDIWRDLSDISAVHWTAEETKGRNKGNYDFLRIISSFNIRKDFIRINFDIDAATYLVQSYIMQHPTALLKIDNRNPNAYALGYKIAQHNSMDNNAAIGTNNTLSVESLLSAAPEIQTIEELQARGQRDWKNKIKKPLENSLDELVRVGVLSRWEYRDPTNSTTYTPESAQPMTWAQYSRLMVDFIMVNEPDQTKRRAAILEAKIAAAANKENKQEKKKRGRPRKNTEK